MLQRAKRSAYFYILAAIVANSPAMADQVHRDLTVATKQQSNVIDIPISNSPIIMTCTQTVSGDVGAGQVTLTSSTTDNGMVYNGYDISGIITNGQSNANGHIVYCDFSKLVEIRAVNAHQIVVKNNGTVSTKTVLMMTY